MTKRHRAACLSLLSLAAFFGCGHNDENKASSPSETVARPASTAAPTQSAQAVGSTNSAKATTGPNTPGAVYDAPNNK